MHQLPSLNGSFAVGSCNYLLFLLMTNWRGDLIESTHIWRINLSEWHTLDKFEGEGCHSNCCDITSSIFHLLVGYPKKPHYWLSRCYDQPIGILFGTTSATQITHFTFMLQSFQWKSKLCTQTVKPILHVFNQHLPCLCTFELYL